MNRMNVHKGLCLLSMGLLSLFYIYLPGCEDLYYWLGLFPLTGALAVWTAIQGWGLDKKCRFRRYNLAPAAVAFGLGGALAGLPLSAGKIAAEIADLHRALAAYEAAPEFRLPPDSSAAWFEISLFFLGCGQLFWLVWPLSIIEICNQDRPGLAEFCHTFKVLAVFWGLFALIPWLNALMAYVLLLFAAGLGSL